MLTEIELSELVGSKFSHDLAGPIGAVSNGLEFLDSADTEMKKKAMNLLEVSAQQAISRLQFFRQIYGTVPNIGEANLLELKSLTTKYLEEYKIELRWDILSGPDMIITNRTAKLILNIIYCANNILLHNGTITVSKQSGKKVVIVRLVGQTMRFENENENIILGNFEGTTINTKNVNYYLINKLLKQVSGTISINKNPDNLEFLVDLSR